MKIRRISIVFIVLCVLSFWVFAYSSTLPTEHEKKIAENSYQREQLQNEITALNEQKQQVETELSEIKKQIENKQSIQSSLHELNNKLKGLDF